MEIVRIKEKEIAVLSPFAMDVFIDYYTPLIGNKQAQYMADLFLSEKAMKQLMKKGAVFNGVYEKQKIIGFSEYMIEEERLFLSKLYADKNNRGKGVGTLLFEDTKAYAKKNGLKKIYLTVNKGNTPSYEIYLHLGFKVIDAVKSDIGHNYIMDDYIMEYTLETL